jgi:hypothetical protein
MPPYPKTLLLKCVCGSLQGELTDLSPAINRRFVCYCRDCQAYAHYLGQVERVLDENGGTEVVPIHPAKIKLTRGIEHLACVRLSSDGMIRWYASCCKTPIANTQPSAKLPCAGVIHTIADTSGLGQVYARANGKYGRGVLPAGTSNHASPKLLLSTLKFMLIGVLKKLHSPSPFFSSETGRPTVEPLALSDAQYDSLINLSECPGARS